MRRLILIILALATLLPSLAQAYDVLVLQSRRDAGYEEALAGFRTGSKVSERLIVLSDYADVDVVRIVREDRPKLILALGDAALKEARKIRQTPVVALMSLRIHDKKASPPNLTGIGMFAPPESYIRLFKAMKTERIGVVYNPARSGWYLQLARKSAREAGITLESREVKTPQETIEQLATLAGKVDAVWMLPDSVAVTRESSEAYFRFGQQHSVPVVSFAAGYLGLGAATVLEIDRTGLGQQAAGMVTAILDGADTNSTAPVFPKEIKFKSNSSVLKRLGQSLVENFF
ncbi:MAG: ABC transporter substrate binding protein [Deltaproteobacteria bacterium]|nr:ABC transporter substrate binding protein [Deltaproteobacteria bacterium]